MGFHDSDTWKNHGRRRRIILTMHQKLLSTLSKYIKIVFVGGGTGGHISPIVSLSKELREKKFSWLGWEKSEEEFTAKENSIVFEIIPTLKLKTTQSPRILLYPLVLLHGIWKARKILQTISTKDQKRDEICIFSKGWPGSVAVGIAAWTLSIPLYIHESDTIPGRSNRILSKFATKIFLGFESAKIFFQKEKTEVIGQILDPLLFDTTKKGKLHWKTEKKHILVICGSQGSQSIFEEIIRSCSHMDTEWIIVLGRLNMGMRHDFDHFPHIHILDWIEKEDQRDVFQKTDIAITRGSATTLAELDVFEIQKVIIPLPISAGNHQFYNAKEYEKKGDTLLEQKYLSTLHNILKKHVGITKEE